MVKKLISLHSLVTRSRRIVTCLPTHITYKIIVVQNVDLAKWSIFINLVLL
jgi:hypothetical protein